MEEVLVPIAEVNDGMFSDEARVSFTTIENKPLSLFVDRGLIQKQDGRDFLRAMGKSISLNGYVVLLPSEAFETSSRWANIAGARSIAA